MDELVGGLMVLALALAVTAALVVAAGYLVPVGVGIASLYALFQYLRTFFECLVGDVGELDPPSGPDRSFTQYFYGQAWSDTSTIVRTSFQRNVAAVPEPVRSALLPVHVGVNILGIVAFALAFAVALAYLIQESLLRKKQLGGLFQRLPPLDVLDSLGFQLVTIGFPLLTVGIITGAVVAARLGEHPSFNVSRLTAMLAWLFFAGVLFLRVLAGWRGRRAAIGTMLGFACAVVVLVGYVLRAEAL